MRILSSKRTTISGNGSKASFAGPTKMTTVVLVIMLAVVIVIVVCAITMMQGSYHQPQSSSSITLLSMSTTSTSADSNVQTNQTQQQSTSSTGTTSTTVSSIKDKLPLALGVVRPSLILAHPMDLIRRRIPLTNHYNFSTPTTARSGDECSCSNPMSKSGCCVRIIRRNHKMGFVLSSSIFETATMPKELKNRIKLTQGPKVGNYLTNPPNKKNPLADYRVVLLVRNIYASLVSGYLYHRSGRECHLDHRGNPLKEGYNPFANVKRWHRVLNTELDPPRNGRSLCKYLEEESDIAGMKAYVDYIFHSQYVTLMTNWAMAQEIPQFQERTRVICYDDLSASTGDGGERQVKAVNSVLDFLFNGTDNHEQWQPPPPTEEKGDEKNAVGNGAVADDGRHGGHGTSNDPMLRNRLVEVIRKVDAEYFGGDIAWFQSMMQC